MTSSKTPRTLPALPEEIWRLIIQHGVTLRATSDFRTWRCDHSNEINDQRLHDPTTRFDHQRERRDYAAMLPLAQTSKFFSRLVANELYQNIVLGLRSLSIQDPPPSSGWAPGCPRMDIDGFEHTIRKIRKLPSSYGKIFQQLEAVSIATTRFKNDSDEAFSVYSSPLLTGFQVLGFLIMRHWHRLADYRSTLVHLDIGHLYPQLINARWVGLTEPSGARAREAREFRRILSTFTRLKFLRVSYALLIGQLEEKTKNFGDMLSELLPPSVGDFQIAVFNHGVDNRYDRPNIDMSVKCFFEGLESWTWDLEQYRYRLDFFAKYRNLWDISILVHQKGNSQDQSRRR
ncbi:uncharacterized protein B0T23DRAFT_395271 [Neurospora hispaniola]|uniref:Uncharacterized protein n=1 Tax=Neurospora hispaniola TaxID=588809 RepID=A0AAJ0MSX5_9PEZI|nr:hypothetical protein B0T23DRAFT_395271 [Neurospora hispaniola]